jgi:hypothetical protein
MPGSQFRHRTPRPAALLVHVTELERGITQPVADLHRGAEFPFTQHVAEHQRAAATDECAERTTTGAEVRLADAFELQPRPVVEAPHRFHIGQPGRVIGQQAVDAAKSTIRIGRRGGNRVRPLHAALIGVGLGAIEQHQPRPAVPVDGERNRRTIRRHRQRRTRGRNAADAGRDVGDSPHHG